MNKISDKDKKDWENFLSSDENLKDKDINLPPNDPLLFFIQRIRDEAHRFAIGSHRALRKKAIGDSPLDGIPGVGANRKQALLHHFGSARGVGGAGISDLEGVYGISSPLAKKNYDHFHPEG